MSSLLRLEQQQKRFLNELAYIAFFPAHLELKRTRFQTNMGKIYTRFQTKTAQKPYAMGRHIPT